MLFVIAQFIGIIFLLLNSNFVNFSLAALILLVIGLLIAYLAIITMKISNLNIIPELKAKHQLRTTGVYRYVRHPMYLSLLLQLFALVLTNPTLVNYIVYALIFIILYLKSNKEEFYLNQRFPTYKTYQQQTGRFLPKIL